jgi:hypothetical protein
MGKKWRKMVMLYATSFHPGTRVETRLVGPISTQVISMSGLA